MPRFSFTSSFSGVSVLGLLALSVTLTSIVTQAFLLPLPSSALPRRAPADTSSGLMRPARATGSGGGSRGPRTSFRDIEEEEYEGEEEEEEYDDDDEVARMYVLRALVMTIKGNEGGRVRDIMLIFSPPFSYYLRLLVRCTHSHHITLTNERGLHIGSAIFSPG